LAAGLGAGDSVRAILLDIEGTTTPIDFVYKTLFPYARARLGEFLLRRAAEPEIPEDIAALRAQYRADSLANLEPPQWLEHPPQAELASATGYALWLMDRDSKCAALKSLQGKIWREGYERGELQGEVYADVAPALSRWVSDGKLVAIFSSGSVLAQKLLFRSTTAGDLTRFINAYFDTTTGPKNAPESYVKIARSLALEPAAILFVSDVTKELDAARAAGMKTALSVRPGTAEPAAPSHPAIHSFDEIFSQA
jgi:enolase-phosphatase E1